MPGRKLQYAVRVVYGAGPTVSKMTRRSLKPWWGHCISLNIRSSLVDDCNQSSSKEKSFIEHIKYKRLVKN